MANERKLIARLQWVSDKKSLDETVKSLMPLESRLEQIDKLTADIAKRMEGVGKSGKAGSDKAIKGLEGIETKAKRVVEELGRVAAGLENLPKVSTPAGAKTAKDVDSVNKKLKEGKKNADAFGEAMRFGVAGFTTQIIGVQLKTFVQPFFDLPHTLATFAGRTNEVASQWLDVSSDLEQAQLRIAQVIAREVLPLMETLADTIENIARFAEKNPEVVKLVTGGAVSLLAIATVLQGLGFALSAFGTVKNLGGVFGLAGGAAAGAGGGAVAAGATGGILATILPLIPAIVTAIGAYLVLSNFKLPGREEDVLAEGGRAGGQLAAIIGGAFPAILAQIRGADEAEVNRVLGEATLRLGEFLGVVEKTGDALEEASDTEPILPKNVIQNIANILDRINQSETQYGEDRAKIVEDFGQARVDLERRFAEQREDLIDQYNQRIADLYADYLDQVQDITDAFAKQDRRAEEDYYRRRTQAAKDFGKEIERLEEDHQAELERLRREHLLRVEDLVASRDALGLARELRRYEEERSRSEEENDKRIRRENEDFADRVREMEEQFSVEKARRLEDFEDRLRELDENYQRQKAKLAQQQQDRLNQLDEQLAEERDKVKENLDEQLELLDERYQKEKENLERAIADQIILQDSIKLTGQNIQLMYDTGIEYFNRLSALRSQVLNSLNFTNPGGGPTIPTGPGGRTTRTYPIGRQFGGYVLYEDLYRLGERGQREFVLSNPVVRALEGQVGVLDQEKFLNLTRPVQAGPQTIRITVDQTNWHITGALTVGEKNALMRQVREVTYEAIESVNLR